MIKYINKTIYIFVIATFNVAYAQSDGSASTHAISLAAYSGHGDFGFDLDTRISYLPLRYEYNSGNWGFQLLAPLLEVDGPGAVLVNLGGVNRIFAESEPRTQSGMGDLVASAVYRLPRTVSSRPFVDFRLDIKLPTANEEKGLGTGEADANLQVDLSHYLGQWLIFGSLGYSFRGDSELFPELENGIYGQFGAAFPLQDSVSMGLLYDYREAVASFTTDIHEIGPYINWQINENWTATGMSLVGLSKSSVDYSVLGQLRYSW